MAPTFPLSAPRQRRMRCPAMLSLYFSLQTSEGLRTVDCHQDVNL